MNERIKQLAEQARNYALDEKRIYERMHNTEQCMEEYREVYNAKFAELIVRECVDIVSGTAVNTPPNDLFYGYNLGVNKAAENIKERFGIEELSPFNTVNS